mgnify:CR=1 FL=1
MSTVKSSAESLTLNADGSGNDVLIQSNGSTKAIVTAEGTLGIGTTAPLRQLHISNTSANPEIAFTSGTSGAASLLFGDGLTGTDVYKGYVQYQHNGDYMLIATGATTRLRVDSDGLKFNADTAAANALDDYEEGTYTATLTMGSGTAALSDNQLTYTKIGRQVHVSGQVRVGSVSSPDGSMQISLPFTVANINGGLSVGNYRSYNIDTPNDGVQAVIHGEPNEALATLQWSRDGATSTPERATENGYFMIGLTYPT